MGIDQLNSVKQLREIFFHSLDQLLVLLCLTGFSITAPILTIFGQNAALFSFHNVDSFLLVTVYALVVALLPPLLLWIITLIVGVGSRRMGGVLHYVIVALLSGLWLIQLGKWTLGIEQLWLVAMVAVLGGVTFVFVYANLNAIKPLMKIGAIAPFVAIASFLFWSDTGSLVDEAEVEIAYSNTDADLPSIVFIMLDEFPTLALFNEEGSLDTGRFPNLAELMQQATWYRHYSVLADKTHHSVPSILSGGVPRTGTASMGNYPNNLFSLLAPTHYLTSFESVTKLCKLSQCSEGAPQEPVTLPDAHLAALLSQTLSLWLQRNSLTQRGEVRMDDFEDKPGAAEKSTTECLSKEKEPPNTNPHCSADLARSHSVRFGRFLDAIIPGEKSALYFIHIDLPHIPWRYYEDGQLYTAPNLWGPFSHRNDTGGDWLTKFSEYRFFLQAQYVDRLLGEVFSKLKKLDVWDDYLVVVTADHGRSFMPNTDARMITPKTIGRIAYAPLFIKRPHQERGEIDDSNVIAYDVLPTVADILGIDLPWPVVGLPIGHPGIAERGDQKIYFPRKNKSGFVGGLGDSRSFSDKENFPTFSLRWIGAQESIGDLLMQLNQGLDLERYIGRSSMEFESTAGGSAVVADLALLRQVAAEATPPGMIMGHLEFEPADGDKVLVAVNGKFVTGSPLVEFQKVPNTFFAMLPNGVLKSENNIGVFLVDESGLIALDIH